MATAGERDPDDTFAVADALAAPVLAYLDGLRVERGYSPHTLAGYRRDLARLVGFARRRGLAQWRALDPEQMRGFIAAEHRRGLSATSVQRLLSSCRGFFGHLLREGGLAASPAADLRAPRAPRKLPQVLDADEMSRLLDFPILTPEDVRDRAMLELLYSSGLRRAELCGLRWGDLQLEEGLVRVRGKGGRSRDVPVGSKAREALSALRALGAATPAQPVFKGARGGAIGEALVGRRIKAVAQRQGIDKRVYPHLFRHSCASHVLESSGDLRAVQELLGHADIATTQIYTHLDFQHLARVYDDAHPRARRRSRSEGG
ncbi:MAG: tyrosine recombinase XerC [Xanthomonadaceae bacterium]|nr:tyrosine recombinase XerC [Xanthomonadaceae bacterium]